LQLRPVGLDDVEMIWNDISDHEIARLMAWTVHTDKAQTREFLQAEVKRREAMTGISWAILNADTFCGLVSLVGILRTHRALTYNRAELAYWIGRKFQQQGIATEACCRVLQFAFRDLGLHKVVVGHFRSNTASENLIRRLGFRCVGAQL